MNKILQMLTLQQQLNDATNGEGWEYGKTKNDKLIDWKRCAYLECAELIESYPWKHWKNIDAQPDYENIKIETVDIWHFVMAEAIKDYKIKNLGTLKDLAKKINALPNFSIFEAPSSLSTKSYYEQIEIAEVLMKSLFCDSNIEVQMEAFINVALESGLNLDTLYKLYVGKNILNKFRQDHGYKDGSYVKIWDGKEDNVTMQSLLEMNKDLTPELLYNKLKEAYPKE